jgi:hypothetical protein
LGLQGKNKMGGKERENDLRTSLLDAGREVLILVGLALVVALGYLIIRGDWSVVRIAGTLQIAGVGVGAVGLLIAMGATRRSPTGGVNATPDELAAAARERAQGRTHSLGTMAVAALAGLLLFGVGVLLQALGT